MKSEKSLGQVSLRMCALSLIMGTCFAAARAQSYTVFPAVCTEPSSQSGTTTLTSNVAVGGGNPAGSFTVSSPIPLFATAVLNPGGANEETVLVAYAESPASLIVFTSRTGIGAQMVNNHTADEPIQWTYNGATAYFGYNNTGNSTRSISLGVQSRNFFTPGAITYPGYNQPTQFLPGIHQRAFSLNLPPPQYTLDWSLDGNSIPLNINATPRCATITYQGKLSNGGAPATGNYDLRFTVYDALTGGAAQGDAVAAANVAVSNGVFTVPLDFYSALSGNNNARFLEIAVRPASQNANDPYTTLLPRQLITDVPFAINAQRAFSVSGGFVQLPLTTGAPFLDCNAASQYGQTRVDATNLKLYICTSAGWKSTVLQ
jgi:hypothetical protein